VRGGGRQGDDEGVELGRRGSGGGRSSW